MPAKKGIRVSIIILRRSGPTDDDCPVLRINNSTSTGVRITPRILDKAALNSAAAVLPRATSVSTTEVEIVDGSTQRWRKPSRLASGSQRQRHGPTTGERTPT